MVRIRLTRAGAKKSPFYRIIVTDHRSPRDGSFLESIGTFDPTLTGTAKIDTARLEHWVKLGAQLSPTVASLAKKAAKQTPAA